MSDVMRKIVNFPVGLRTTATAATDNDIPNKAQVLAFISGKLNAKDSVRAASESNVDIATGGLITIDGVALSDGDRVLLKDQADNTENGIYIASAGAWSRSADADENGELRPYTTVFARDGNTHAGHKYALQATNDIVIGTDAQVWVHEATLAGDASDITVDQTNLSNFSGATVQSALESVDDAFDTTNGNVTALDTRLDNLSGVTGSNLETFTGTTFTDNSDIKSVLQEAETAIESNAQIYANNGYESASTALTTGNAINFNHALGSRWLSNIEVYEAATGEKITSTVTITAVDANNLTVQNDDVDINVIVVARV
ncbi:putative tail fiber protein H [Vibrio phage vB_VpP_1]|nr:putative tail fiber protein H [Vibrio phage vB_VpP_1]